MVGKKLAVEVGHLFRSAFSECAGGGVDTLHFDFACFPTFCGGLGLRDPETVHETALLAAAFTYRAGAEDLPTCFWEEETEAWGSTRAAYGFPEAMLDVDFTNTQMPDWSNQRWWQGHVSKLLEARWKSTAPLRLRKVKDLNEARNAVDITALVSQTDGTAVFSSHAWWL